ncbi:MAG: (2Fe-2S) ferredoxin domain-containing protein [Myxococcales bacterium]|nr:(2Fe-2S) ferredoxin domain-containing protein [Myxococcales bacterium]
MAGPDQRPTNPPRLQILVCDGPSCGVTYESELLKERLAGKIAGDPELRGRCAVVDYNCFGRCSEGPNLFVRALGPGDGPGDDPDPSELERQRGFYPGMDEAKCDRVLDEHCRKGQPVVEWVDDY